MNPQNSQGLNRENSQSFRYNLQEMNFDTNFEAINEGLCTTPYSALVMEANNSVTQLRIFPASARQCPESPNSLQSTFYLSLQQNNNIGFNNLKKETGRPLLLEFPIFNKLKEEQQPPQPKDTEHRVVRKSKQKRNSAKDIPKKGLREISQQVKELICKKDGLTYNDVADSVIEESQAQMHPNELEKSATVNIKRRVYDVLAVLSSLKLLQRDSKKKIFATPQCHKIGIGACKNKQQLQKIGSSINSVKMAIKEKQELLKKSINEYKKLRALCQRNIGYIQQQNILREKQIDRFLGPNVDYEVEETFDINLTKKIYFPFVYTTLDEQTYVEFNTYENRSVITFESQNQARVRGDMDFVLKMDLPECSVDETVEKMEESLSEPSTVPKKK